MARPTPTFGGKRAIIVKRGAKCPGNRHKKIYRNPRTGARVEICLVRK
jgi:hypothetical protein